MGNETVFGHLKKAQGNLKSALLCKPKIKICGLTRLADIEAVNAIKPDYIGFVFAHKSPRWVSDIDVPKWYRRINEEITTVGVYAGWSIHRICEQLAYFERVFGETGKGIEMIQLHSGADENFIRQLKERTNLPIIKAISVQKKGDAQAWENSAADYLLLDHKGGGTGETFDWNLIGSLKKPFFLAGGLNAQNVSAAVEKVRPFAVDVSSGVELSPGIKCPEKIKKFTENF
jgi:phosphoribosylanthranilate isomerase